MSDEAYIEHIFGIYSAYIESRWKAGGEKGEKADLAAKMPPKGTPSSMVANMRPKCTLWTNMQI